MNRIAAAVLGAFFMLPPLSARAADLVVWWDEGYYPEEREAVEAIVAAFEQETGKEVELVLYPQDKLPYKIEAALEAGRPPDFAFGFDLNEHDARWAFEDRLVDLSDAVGHFSDLFDPDALASVTWRNARTGQNALYGLPMGRTTNHLHVWKSLSETAGYKLADIPRDWEAFWSFWCDQVQPAVRRATGRDDIWGIGLPMSGQAFDTWFQFHQFLTAYEADYVSLDGHLVIDDPEIRRRLIKAMDSYTAVYRKGCTPPDSLTWENPGNNAQFHAQAVVMTPNETLSIPNALKPERPDDYYENTATIEWPLGPTGEPFPILGNVLPAVVFRDGSNVASAKEFVRFLVAEGWLMHYLNFSGERMLPSISKLLDQPFWLDPSDPHRMASVMQVSSRSMAYNYAVASGNWRHVRVDAENVWGKAIHRIAADGISPEQAVDEAIARIKQILSE
jgi:multiple sugar transport system substrate-binding protein